VATRVRTRTHNARSGVILRAASLTEEVVKAVHANERDLRLNIQPDEVTTRFGFSIL